MSVKATQPDSEEKVQESNERPKDQPAAQTQSVAGMAPTLLNLQRTHGNRYVQSVLSVARKVDGEREASREAEVEETIKRADGGQPLDRKVRGQMESAMGADFSGVRVHTDTQADALSVALSARAFTTGNDIFFRQGEYDPASYKGRELLAHELTHVVQQKRGGGVQRKLSVSEPGDACEQEADAVAQEVMQREGAADSSGEVAQVTRPRLTSGPMLSLNRDGGPPPPTRPPVSPPGRDAGPDAGQSPAPATPPVTVSIGTVNAPNTPSPIRRIPPRVDTNVAVTVSGTAAPPITLSIEGGSSANGTATINGAATHDITGTSTVRLRGVDQTTPGNAGNLKLVAHQGGTRLADSNGFSVAAYPVEIGFNFNSILRGVTLPGVALPAWAAKYDLTFVSDSGDRSDCNLTKVSENILVDTATGIFATSRTQTSGFITTTSPQADHHGRTSRDAASFRRNIESDTSSRKILHQFFRFSDERTGIAESLTAGPKVPKSGFKITHTIASSCGGTTKLTAKKEGFANNGVTAGDVDDTSVKMIEP